MTWSYNLNDLATSEKDQVRMEIGDIVANAPATLADEEISQAIATEANLWGASARCAEMLGRRYELKADVRLGRALAVTYSKMASQYMDAAIALRKKATAANVPWAGGVYVLDKQMTEQNRLLVAPAFTRNMQENPWVGGYTPDSGGARVEDAGDS